MTVKRLFFIFCFFYYILPYIVLLFVPYARVQHLIVELPDPLIFGLLVFFITLFSHFVAIVFDKILYRLSVSNLRVGLSIYLCTYLCFFVSIFFLINRAAFTDFDALFNLDRDKLFYDAASHSYGSLSMFVHSVLVVCVMFIYFVTRRNVVLFFILPYFFFELLILSRNGIFSCLLLFVVCHYYVRGPVPFIIYVLIFLLYFLRVFLGGSVLETFDISEYRFEFLGEFFNTFSGTILAFKLDIDYDFQDGLALVFFYLKPPFVPFDIPMVAPPVVFNDYFLDNFSIYGLAGNLLTEAIVIGPLFLIFLVIWFLLVFLIYRFGFRLGGGFMLFVVLFMLASVSSIFRWSLIVWIGSILNFFLYFALPLFIISKLFLRKVNYDD